MANPKDRAVQDQAPPIARHEFGHYIVGRVLGFRVGDVSLQITFPNYHSGTSSIELANKINDIKEAASYIENRIIVLYAGALAQTLKGGEINNAEAHSILGARQPVTMPASASQDYAKARELVHVLRSITQDFSEDNAIIQQQLDEIDTRVWNKAADIVKQESSLINRLGNILANKIRRSGERVTMTRDEIEKIPEFQARFQTSVSPGA